MYTKLHSMITDIISSDIDVTNYELELRFGKKVNKFSPNIGEEMFNEIYSMLTARKFYKITENAYIHDKIYNDGSTERKIQKVDEIMFGKIQSPPFNNFTTQKFIKEKINQYTYDFLRINYNKENPIEFNPENLLLKCDRMKYRVSIMFDKIFRFDFTIVNEEFSVEIEVLLPKIKSISQFNSIFTKFQKFILPITKKMENNFINYIQPQNPHTMVYSDLFTLISNAYTVTDKADGIRTFLKITNKKALLINPKTNEVIRELGESDKDQTLIDGEFVNGRFYAFDLMYFNGKDYRSKNFLERIKILNKIVRDITIGLIIKVKTFYSNNIFENGKKILEGKHPYKIDGLIFTPIYQRSCEDDQPIFKWKIRNTIDVRIKYNSRDDFTYFIYGKKYGRINEWGHEYFERNFIRTNDSRTRAMHNAIHDEDYDDIKKKIIHYGQYKLKSNSRNKYFGKPGKPNEDFITKRPLNRNIKVILDKYDIIEYEFRNGEWYPLRKRTFDKDEANAIRTIDGVLKVIEEDITITKMIDFEKEYKTKYKFESVGKMYDLVAQDQSFKRDNWRKFHNFVKRQLILKASNVCIGGAYLDLACGKGGDIGKYINLGYKNILAIDSSERELYGRNGYIYRLMNIGFKDQGLYFEKNDIKVTVVCGDISKNIRNGGCSTSDKDKNKLERFFGTVEKFDCISIMFAIHYMFGNFVVNKWVEDTNKIKSFFNNITDLLKPTGKFIGTYLNSAKNSANNIEKTEDEKFLELFKDFRVFAETEDVFRNHGLPFYKITNKEDHIEIRNDVWGWDNILTEPRIDSNIFTNNVDSNLVESVNTSFEDLYKKFRMQENIILSRDEQRLGFKNNCFMYVVSPMKLSKKIILL